MPTGSATQPLAGGTYNLYNVATGLVMDDPGKSTIAGTQITAAGTNRGTDQLWGLTPNGSGYYTVKNASSGLYLAGSGANLLQQQTADGAADQLWQAVAVGGGYVFKNKQTGLVWDDPNASASPGTGLDLAVQAAGANQTWYVAPVTYNWSLVTGPAGAAAPTFAPNAGGNAGITAVTFAAPRRYSFRVAAALGTRPRPRR